jgi:hypothetical protein
MAGMYLANVRILDKLYRNAGASLYIAGYVSLHEVCHSAKDISLQYFYFDSRRPGRKVAGKSFGLFIKGV